MQKARALGEVMVLNFYKRNGVVVTDDAELRRMAETGVAARMPGLTEADRAGAVDAAARAGKAQAIALLVELNYDNKMGAR